MHHDMEFKIGDLVTLSTHDLCTCDNRKFAACFIGPFQVLEHICKLAYRIELPPIYSALHNILYVLKLKLYIPGGGNGTSINVHRVLVNGEKQYEVEKIVAEYSCSNYKLYLVHWVGYLVGHDLQLCESELAQEPDVLAAWKWQLSN